MKKKNEKKKETVFERVELLYHVLKNFEGRQIKSLNVKECKTIIEAYGDLTGEVKRKSPIKFLRYRKKDKESWQEVLMDNIGEDVIRTDYI